MEETIKPEDAKEPAIGSEDILILSDPQFNSSNVCIVTGAGTGIGRATAIAAAANQLMTIGLDINEEEGRKTQKLARDMGGQMVFLPCDLSRDADMDKAVTEAAKLGAIKYLANIAGIQHIDSVENFPMDKYDQMQSLMLRAPFYLSKLAIPHMKNSHDGCGVIANMASVHAHICTRNKPVYNITKFGLRALSQSISAEGEGRVRSFTLSTGFVKTPLALNQINAQAAQRGIKPEEVVRDVMMGASRIKEMMSPIEAANLMLFGFSRFAKYLVGGDMLFDGGMVLTY
ncbi:3-hydroxybutyrate dehydrogenase [Desulfatibacillum alkenivorans DSM 16219]|jgi:3-hydroxybutyrate dehydrogenase|uniref:3-hydroxybutyrate dehydrogenase n=1 Tax=Desulfatibacillum alkenivorans DSM 16219 TaxID=1121393 RepID=A0A1M6YK17_9BACT|nr:SDR family oxidoreductase [Desulfatibacillum alkenivorans]SHL18671.1 3-hydroxybutyrate dehydrogenase [Desulfatibacillum alkenivorans DSM 16219]